ncbi:MAG: sigma 54-interacting transcriptional regulator [Flavobacteriaceae bacterium]|nr:sigma 54-interacting transcriptional regulator [Flavobacteriaceae bacterium]
MDHILEALKKVSFFTNLSDDQLMSLCEGLDLLSFHLGEVVFEKGSKGDALYIIVQGSVEVHQGKHVFATLSQGDYFGEYSMFDQQERSASVRTLEPTQLIGISAVRFLEWMREDANYVESIMKDLIHRHRMLDAVQEELSVSKTHLQQTKDELDVLIKGARDPIFMINEKGRIIHANPAGSEILENDDIVGRNFLLFLSDASRELVEEKLSEIPLAQGVLGQWIELIGSEGKNTRHEVTLSRIDHNQSTLFVLILRNIEDRLLAEKTIDQLTSEAQYLKSEIDQLTTQNGIIATAPVMKGLLRQIEHVAPTSATVLITGETGTGKELVARAIHNASDRKDRSLIRINCGAIPENLIESELFGHVKGAFTGAAQDRKGRFQLAHNGTLFLDEIGELPISLQPKLLRVIQEGEFEPVGSNETQKVDVRILAATHRDLLEQSKKGQFREDLYYRLHVFPVHVPPLRERGEDVIHIAEFMLKNMAAKFNKPVIKLTSPIKARLIQWEWKGNVRELQNVLERAVILSDRGKVDWSLLLTENSVSKKNNFEGKKVITHKELQALERENIIRALKQCHWKVSGTNGAAELLGMIPTTLQSRIKALAIQRPI